MKNNAKFISLGEEKSQNSSNDRVEKILKNDCRKYSLIITKDCENKNFVVCPFDQGIC